MDPEEMKQLEEAKKKAEKPVGEANIERDNNQVIKNVVKDNNPEASDTEIEALIEDLKEKAIGGDEEK
jgi:alpha-galactosidase/6-phospho-beta-glucosidase family protein